MADKAINARLVVHNINTMKPIEFRRTISWLRSIADDMEIEGKDAYSNRFTARLFKHDVKD